MFSVTWHNFITFDRKDAGDFFSSYLPLKILTFCKKFFFSETVCCRDLGPSPINLGYYSIYYGTKVKGHQWPWPDLMCDLEYLEAIISKTVIDGW